MYEFVQLAQELFFRRPQPACRLFAPRCRAILDKKCAKKGESGGASLLTIVTVV
jgi:hypothetical protein